ncbi:MAG: tetratricopeptide repeat protein [Planctomycetota bacterium]
MRPLALVALAALAALAPGCVTQERIKPLLERQTDEEGNIRWVQHHKLISGAYDPNYQRYTLDELLKVTDEHPERPRAWWALADYYERHEQYAEALSAYEVMQGRIEEQQRDQGLAYPGGLYLLAKAHVLCGQPGEAVRRLEELFKLQPPRLADAARYPCFAEGHYLLGALYYGDAQWALAEEHLVTYVRLSGDEARVAGMLARIERELRPERTGTTNYARVRAP